MEHAATAESSASWSTPYWSISVPRPPKSRGSRPPTTAFPNRTSARTPPHQRAAVTFPAAAHAVRSTQTPPAEGPAEPRHTHRGHTRTAPAPDTASTAPTAAPGRRAEPASLARERHQRVFVPDDELFQLTGSLTLAACVEVDRYPGFASQIVFRGDERGGFDPWFSGMRLRHNSGPAPNSHSARLISPLAGSLASRRATPPGRPAPLSAQSEQRGSRCPRAVPGRN